MKYPPLAVVQREIIERAEESLHAFTRMAFPYVETARPFLDGRHIHCVAEHLEAVSSGQITRLIVNIPPGYMKSMLTCVMWPTWHWIKYNVSTTWMFASFDVDLTRRDARKARNLITSNWFRERWGDILYNPDEPVTWFWTKDENNRQAGWRFATSIKSKATGHHADMGVIDDPLKPRDALGGTTQSKAAIQECQTWHGETWSSRTFDRKQRREVLIMQRLHSEDLSGYLEKQGGWHVLRLPLEFEAKYAFVTVPTLRYGRDWRTVEGQPLWPEKDGPTEIKAIKKGLGTDRAVASQAQQRPVPVGGNVFKRDAFRFWHTNPEGLTDTQGRPLLPLPLRGGVQLSSWDLAFKGGDGSDRVAYSVWWKHSGMAYLLTAGAENLSFTATCAKFVAVAKQYPHAMRRLVEDKANGPALEDRLKRTVTGITLVQPLGGKIARALACQPVVDSGGVALPWPGMPGCEWIEDWLEEVCGFPFFRFDDQVDSFSQALIYLESKIGRLVDAMNAAKEQGLA